MNREQAIEIERHLKRAGNAIRRAEILIRNLDEEDRAALGEPLGKTIGALNFDLRQAIYRKFPDLRPRDKGSRFVDSKLTWKQVQLPPSVKVLDFDKVILSILNVQWRKTARIVGDVSEHYRSLGVSLDPAIAAARLVAMVDSGLVESAGDLRKWRFSEVRLKG
jgi:uncharacterized protein DUF3658